MEFKEHLIIQKINSEDGESTIYCNNCETIASYRIKLGNSTLRLCESCIRKMIKEIRFYGFGD
jgi:hypothetical protein